VFRILTLACRIALVSVWAISFSLNSFIFTAQFSHGRSALCPSLLLDAFYCLGDWKQANQISL
jgi:hypothetical protein